MKDVAIIDYGMGNINSIKNMLRYLGYGSKYTCDRKDILNANYLILPGVGNYKSAMDRIKKLDLDRTIEDAAVFRKIPLLGICLGMQLLLEYSEEGDCNGLGLIKGKVKRFRFNNDELKVPHMGWDYIFIENDCSLTFDLPENPRFYFVHSYFVNCSDRFNVVATTDYGKKFDSIIRSGNIYGTQFHPEKSHKFGIKIFENFLNLVTEKEQ